MAKYALVITGETSEEFANAVWDFLADRGYVDGRGGSEWAGNIASLSKWLFESGWTMRPAAEAFTDGAIAEIANNPSSN